MEPGIPAHHSDGSMSTEVDAPDGARYEVRLWPLSQANILEAPVRGVRGVLLRLSGGGSPPRGHQWFRAAVSPVGGGPVVGAKLRSDRTLENALLGCSEMLARSGLSDFDEVPFRYGNSAP